jgi:hypothetical protein
MGVGFHDVPENRATANVNKGFGAELGFFAQPGTLPTTKNDDFHMYRTTLLGRGHPPIPFAGGSD